MNEAAQKAVFDVIRESGAGHNVRELIWKAVRGALDAQFAGHTRVVLVKPGDVLLIGGAGIAPEEDEPLTVEFFRRCNIRVAVFDGDIDIDVLTKDGLAALAAGEPVVRKP